MAIRNVDDLYNELSSNESFSGLFSSPEEFAQTMESMSPERREAFFRKNGLESQISKVDFDNALKKKDASISNLRLVGDSQAEETNTPQPKPAVSSPLQPPGNTQKPVIPQAPRITLFPDEPAPGSPLKRKTLEERFPQTEEEKKRQKQIEGIQKVTEELKKNKDVYTPPKKPTQEQVKQSIEQQKQFEREQRTVSDIPVVQKIDWEAVARGEEFKKKSDELARAKKQEQLNTAKQSTNSLFSGLEKGLYDYTLPSGQKFQLDEYAIGRALFENEPIEIFSKTGTKVDIINPNKDILTGETNFNVIDDRSIRDHLTSLGLSEEQTDEEILRLKGIYLQQGSKAASKNLYDQLLTKYNGNQVLANQNYLNYWNNRGLDLLEGSEKEAYHIVKQMEALRTKLVQEQKKGGLATYTTGNIESYRKQLDDLQDQLSELRDNPNNLYDWRTGQFIDTRIRKNDPRVQEIQQENKEFQAKYGDKPKDVLVKRRDELLAQRAFIMGKMKEFDLNIPEEGTWDAAVRALQISAARTAGTGTITLPDGRTVSADVYKNKMDDYNSQLYSVMSELYGLNRAVMLNENVALRKESEGVFASILKNVGIAAESVAREFTPGATTEDANSEYNIRNSLLNALEESGYTVDPSLRSAASASVSETISGSAGMLINSMLQIAVGNIAVPEVMALRWAKGFKDILTNKYGKIGGAVFEQTANAMRSGLIFEAAGQGFSTGVGESGAQAAFDALNLDKILGAKGRLAEFMYRTLIGGAGETFEEVAGQYIQGLTDAGFDPNKAFKDSFGVTPESRLDQILVIGITSLGFSGASNLKILTATRSTLNEILDNPKMAAAYGEVLTPEKKQQIEEVLKAVDDKLADKQSRETNAGVTSNESSEYTPRVNAEQTQKQVGALNEERQKALEQLEVEGGPQGEEQEAIKEQKAAEINAFYDEQIKAIAPPQTTFETFTGTNQNAVLGNADLNSEQTQNFLASLPNARARRNAATLISVANNANATLASVLPNAKVVLHSRESFRDKMSQVGEQADRKGNFSIIQNPDGTTEIEIQINVEDGSVTDIAHEVTHGVLFSKFYGDDKRLAEIAEVRANTALTPEQVNTQIEEINNKYETQFSDTLGTFKQQLEELVNERGNKYLNQFIASYGENAKAEEYLVELTAILAESGELIRQEDPTFFERLLALINKLVGSIGKEAGIKLQKFEDTQEIIDFFNTVASSIRKGEAITETKTPKRDAVQEQTTGQVPVQPEARVGQEVEEGKPQAEPQVATQNKARKEEVIDRTTKQLENYESENPAQLEETNEGFKVTKGLVGLKISAREADKKPSTTKPKNLSFLPPIINLIHLARNNNDLDSIIKNGFDIEKVNLDSPIPGIYFSNEDWSTVGRFDRKKENSVLTQVKNEGLLYFDSQQDFIGFLKDNNIPSDGRGFTTEQMNLLKSKGVKGILLRDDYASQSRNEFIVIDPSIIQSNQKYNGEQITELPSSFSTARSLADAYYKAKKDGVNSKFVAAVESVLDQEIAERKPQVATQEGQTQEVRNKARRDPKEVRKELDEKLASGEVDDVTLSLLEEYAEQIENGTAVFERFSSSEQRGIADGSRTLVEAVLLLGRNVEADETQDERNERQEQEIEDYARERGIWVDNTLKTFNGLYGERLGSGQEAIVWRKDGNTVIKSSNTLQYEDLQLFLDRLVLHNTLFPASAQKLVGFGTDKNGDFEVIIEQPYIPEAEEATPQEIKEYLQNLGFEQYQGFGGGERYKTGEVLLNDAAPRNFVKTENGNIIPIDLILKRNLPEYGFGGTRGLSKEEIRKIEKEKTPEVEKPVSQITNKPRIEPWSTPQQEISSAGTSINKAKLPSVYSDKKFLDLLKGVPGKRIVIADIGSGKYANVNIKPLLEKGEIAEFINDSSKKMLSEKAVPALEEVLGGKEIAYFPYDPFNQPANVNEETINTVRDGGADIAVSPNVLNVIAEAEAREGVIINMANAVGTTGTAVIQIYEGEPKDRGVGKETKTAGETSWQNNQKTEWYMPEVQAYFTNVKRSGNIIIADNKGQMSLFGAPAKVSGSQKLQIKNKARIEDRVATSKKYGVPQRYKGDVGKMIGGELYVHYSANDVLPQQDLIAAEAMLPEGFEYEVIKYNAKDGSFSFISSPDWNTSDEPIVGDAYKVKKNGEVTVTKQKADPQIYHHKWNFVRDDYSGFDVEKSVQRSIDWYRDAKADINMFKIGTQSYWQENAVPLITDTTKIINKGRVDRVDFAIVKDYEDFRNNGFSVEGAYFELEKMNYSPGDIKRYVPEIAEVWRKRTVNKFFATIRRNQGKLLKRQQKIREELQKNPGLEFDTLYDILKDKFEDFELFKAFYEEGADPKLLDEIFGTEYRQTIQKAIDETRDGRKVYNKDILRELRDDARSRKMINMANQMNNIFGFFNGIMDNEEMINMLVIGLEGAGFEFAFKKLTDDMRSKREELQNNLNIFKKISRGEIEPDQIADVAQVLSLAGRLLRMGRGLFQNEQSLEDAIVKYLESATWRSEGDGIIRKFKAFKVTDNQRKKIRAAVSEFREAKAEYDKEIKLLEESEDAYTDAQFEAFDKAKIKFEQSARKLKVTIDAFRKKSTGNWFTSMTAQALLSFRTIVIGFIGNLELMLANSPKKGKLLIFGWSRALANKLVPSFTRTSITDLNAMIKRGAYGNIDPTLYRKMAFDQGLRQIKNIFQNTIASVSTNEDSFFETQTTIDSMKELPTGLKMVGILIKNIFKKDIDKMSDQEWAETFDQLLVLMNEKDEKGNNKLELMNPKGYQAATTLMRGVFGYVPTVVGKAIAVSGDRVFYQYGYYEALAAYATAQGITDPAEIKKFIRLNSVPNAVAEDFAKQEGERRIFANDNAITDWFANVRSNIAKKEKNLYNETIRIKKAGNYGQRFTRIYPSKIKLALQKMGLTILSPFTRIPSNFVGTAVEKTVPGYAAVAFWAKQVALNKKILQYDELFNIDAETVLSPAKQKEQERMRAEIFKLQREASRYLTSTFQNMQVMLAVYLLLQSGAVGAPYGDDEEEKKTAIAAGIAGQPPGRINLSAFFDYVFNGFDSKGRVYKEGDITFQYTNLGIFGFALTWGATLQASSRAKNFENRQVIGADDEGFKSVTFNMLAESITNGITSLSFIQNIASLISAAKAGKEGGIENFGINLAKTALTVPTAAYGVFGAVERAEGITADNMRNFYPDLEADDSIGSRFKVKLWTSLTGKSPIFLFGLKNKKGEFLSPYASPYYRPQIGPHGEELYKKSTMLNVRSGELLDRVVAYLQASFDPFGFSDYEGFVSSVKKYDATKGYKAGDIVDDDGRIILVKKDLPPGVKFQELNLDSDNISYETIDTTKDFFDRKSYMLNKQGSEATTQLYDLMALYQKATGSRKQFGLLNRFYEPFVQGKDGEGEFGVYIPLKYQRELAKLRGNQILKSYDQNNVKEAIERIQRNADEMSDEEFKVYVEEQVENLLMGNVDPLTLERKDGIASRISEALTTLEDNPTYRSVKRQAIYEGLANGLFTEEDYDRIANAEGTREIVADFKGKLKFKK